MYKLEKREPKWLTLREAEGGDPAVRVRFGPLTRSMKRRAGAAARALFPDLPDEMEGADRAMVGDFIDAVSRETIRLGILAGGEWEGIGDAKGKPVPVTPENVDLFLQDEAMIEAADRLYLVPDSARTAEKNGASPSPNGSSAGARDIARAAPSRGGASNAPSESTRSKAPRPRKSSTS
jgi:hypothetical protein